MPEFRYKAIDDLGNSRKGTQVADSEEHLETILNESGFYLLEANEVQAIVKSGVHKPDIIDPGEENWQQGFYTKPPPGGGELHLHKHEHIHTGAPPAKMSTLSVVSLILGIISILWCSVGFGLQFLMASGFVIGSGGKAKGAVGAIVLLLVNPAFYLCLAAIITGYKALSRCKRLELRGTGLAIAGLTMGGFAIWGPIIIALLFW